MPFDEVAFAAKKFVLETALSAELNVLALRLDRIAQRDPHTRDFTLGALRRALVETIAAFPIYRTYVTGAAVEPADRRFIELRDRDRPARATRSNEGSVYAFLRRVLLTEHDDDAVRERYVEFAMRFQQLTAPVTAKGVEDTAFYRSLRLIALNEVGGDPARFGTIVDEFHRQNASRAVHHPHALLATATHDMKRGEDVRARIAALSEIPARVAARACALVAAQPRAPRDRLAAGRVRHLSDASWARGRWSCSPPSSTREALAASPTASPRTRSKRRARRSCARAGPTRTRTTRARSTRSCARILDPRSLAGVFGEPARRRAQPRRDGHDQRARANGAQSDRTRRSRHVSRRGAVGPEPGRSGQPASGRLSAARVARLRALDQAVEAGRRATRSRAICSPRGPTAASSCTCSQRCSATARRRTGRSDDYTALPATGEHADHVVAFARGPMIVVVPRLPRALSRRHAAAGRLWGDTTVALPASAALRATATFSPVASSKRTAERAQAAACRSARGAPGAVLEPA